MAWRTATSSGRTWTTWAGSSWLLSWPRTRSEAKQPTLPTRREPSNSTVWHKIYRTYAKGAAKYLKYLARVPQTKKGCEPLLYPLARQFHSLSFFKFRNSFHHLNKKRLNESSFLEGFDMLYLVSNRNQSDLGLLFVYYLRHFWKSVNINITCEKRNTTIVKSSKPFLN